MPFASADSAYDGTSILVHFGRSEYAFQKVDYEDGLDGVEFLTNIGQQQQGARTRGIYKTSDSSVEMLRAEWDRMQVHLPANGFGNVTFPVTIGYVHPNLTPHVDKLLACSILGLKASIEATGKATIVTFKMKVRQIVWAGRTINHIRGGLPQGRTTSL